MAESDSQITVAKRRRLRCTWRQGFSFVGLGWLTFLWLACSIYLPPQVSISYPEAGKGRTFVIVLAGFLLWGALFFVASAFRWWIARRFRFSMRTLLVLFTIVCVGLAWYGKTALKALADNKKRNEAIKKFTAAGGVFWPSDEYTLHKKKLYAACACLFGESGSTFCLPLHSIADRIDNFFVEARFGALWEDEGKGLTEQDLVDIAVQVKIVGSVSLPLSLRGEEFLARAPVLPEVKSLSLLGTETSDFDIALLKKLPNLSSLYIAGSKVSWQWYQELHRRYPKLTLGFPTSGEFGQADFDDLRSIRLSTPAYAVFTGEFQNQPSADQKLCIWTFTSRSLTPSDWSILVERANSVFERHPQLGAQFCGTSLRLSLKDEEVAHLLKLKRLTHLDLYSTDLTDAGLTRLAERKDLRSILIITSNASDAGLAAFRDHPSLEVLIVNGMNITDASEDVFKSLPKLRYIQLVRTNMTTECVSRLERHVRARKSSK